MLATMFKAGPRQRTMGAWTEGTVSVRRTEHGHLVIHITGHDGRCGAIHVPASQIQDFASNVVVKSEWSQVASPDDPVGDALSSMIHAAERLRKAVGQHKGTLADMVDVPMYPNYMPRDFNQFIADLRWMRANRKPPTVCEDCGGDIDPHTNECTECGTDHGGPGCVECGRFGVHKRTCRFAVTSGPRV